MTNVALERLHGWESFYVIVGSSGAALVGLQFVVIALISDLRKNTSKATISAFGTPTVVHFAGALLISSVMSAPWPALRGTAIAIGVCAVMGFLYALAVTRHAHRQADYKPVAEDWWWYVILPCLVYAAFAIAALLLTSHEEISLFVIGGAALSTLLMGIRNAWDTVTYIVTEGDKAAEPPDGG